jgi:hypothetical protein
MLHSRVYEASKLLLQFLLLIKLARQLLVLFIIHVLSECHVQARQAGRRGHGTLLGGCLLLPQLQASAVLHRMLASVLRFCVSSAQLLQ